MNCIQPRLKNLNEKIATMLPTMNITNSTARAGKDQQRQQGYQQIVMITLFRKKASK